MSLLFAALLFATTAAPMAISISSSEGSEQRPMTEDEIAICATIASRYNGEMKPEESWTAGSGTNDVSIFVCTDVLSHDGTPLYVFRDFTFSADGRLVSISPVQHSISITTTYTTAKPAMPTLRSKKSITNNAP